MKRIVICMDGTWQNVYWQTMETDPVTGGPLDRRTNVAKVALLTATEDDQNHPQLVFYSPGVGARSFMKRDRKVANYEGATGEGSEENLIAAYLFLSFNYTPGDQIFMFGFSRGAFCVRSLAGLIRRCGILKREHVAQVRNALELYRLPDDAERERLAPMFRNEYSVGKVAGVDTALDDPSAIRVDYVGVFDTVVMRKSLLELVGLEKPRPEYTFHDLKLGNHVLSARQALALDERRNTLPATPWSNIGGFCIDRQCNPRDPEAPYQQKWFAGAHGDVGGGQCRKLSAVSRKWILRGAVKVGLKINESLAVDGDPQHPEFLGGEIEKIRTLKQLGQQDRIVYPEPPDPSERRQARRHREKAQLEHLDQHLHVSVVMRMLHEGLEKPYRPRPLRAFKHLINPNDEAFRAWLEERRAQMFV
jgi:uncharacterized protein (DUF2235 family)